MDIDAEDDAYFMEGHTFMEEVVIESPVNTAMFVISPGFLQETMVKFVHCFFDGLESCRRMIAFQVCQLLNFPRNLLSASRSLVAGL